MTETTQGKFEGLVSASTNRGEALKIVKNLLNANDVEKLGGDADSASEKLIDAYTHFITPLASKTDTFDIKSFNDAVEGEGVSRNEGRFIVDTLTRIGALKEDLSVKVGEVRRYSVPANLRKAIIDPKNGFITTDEAKSLGIGLKFGSIDVPTDWKVQGEYAQTTKEKALEFFNENEWETMVLAQAAIVATHNGIMGQKSKEPGSRLGEDIGGYRPIFFVTGGFGSYFWANAKDVVVQEITSPEQIQKDFSRDMPEGKFFIKKLMSKAKDVREEVNEKELPVPQIWGTPDRRDSGGSEMTVIMGVYDTRTVEIIKNLIHELLPDEKIEIQEKGPGVEINENIVTERVVPKGKNFIKIYGLGGNELERVWNMVNKIRENDRLIALRTKKR